MTGQRLLHYEILGNVSEGGMGAVYRAAAFNPDVKLSFAKQSFPCNDWPTGVFLPGRRPVPGLS